MTERLSGTMGMGMTEHEVMTQELSAEQQYEMSGLFERPGLEALGFMKGKESSAGLQEIYISHVIPLIQAPLKEGGKPRFDKLTSLVVCGSTGSGKSTLASVWYELLMHDNLLKEWADSHNLQLEILSHPTSLVSRLAKRRGIIPPDVPSGSYTPEQYRKVAALKWELTQKHAINQQKKGKAIVLIDEMGSLSSWPHINPHSRLSSHSQNFTSGPMQVEGFDRANSQGLTLALDSRTRNATALFALKRDQPLQQFTQNYRTGLFGSYIDQLVDSRVVVQFSLPSGQVVRADAQTLLECDPHVQEQFVRFMTGTMNSPAGMEESDANFKQLLIDQQIQPDLSTMSEVERGIWNTMHRPSDDLIDQEKLYEKLQGELGFTGGRSSQFITLDSSFVSEGQKTLSMDYFLDSLAAREDEQLTAPFRETVLPALIQRGTVITP